MKVKLIGGRVSHDWAQEPGQVIEVSDTEGRQLIQSQQAESVPEAEQVKRPAALNPRK